MTVLGRHQPYIPGRERRLRQKLLSAFGRPSIAVETYLRPARSPRSRGCTALKPNTISNPSCGRPPPPARLARASLTGDQPAAWSPPVRPDFGAARHWPAPVRGGTREAVDPVRRFRRVFSLKGLLYGEHVRVERHWWNGNRSVRGRRDVYIRTDGERWEVEAQAGGGAGQSRVQQCPGKASAEILADAWLAGRRGWREMMP